MCIASGDELVDVALWVGFADVAFMAKLVCRAGTRRDQRSSDSNAQHFASLDGEDGLSALPQGSTGSVANGGGFDTCLVTPQILILHDRDKPTPTLLLRPNPRIKLIGTPSPPFNISGPKISPMAKSCTSRRVEEPPALIAYVIYLPYSI